VANGAQFRAAIEEFARVPRVDNEQIERDAKIPDDVIRGPGRGWARFGMKIDKAYGGLGLSNLDYCRLAP